ncbi:MAG: [Fe-Fe] hydrogenase large subunit C-terminal domain-containing protein [Verrucomicrobiota bacterium]
MTKAGPEKSRPDQADELLITTIGERCKICYTCVRECPAKAIQLREGQAQVLAERCIGCGNCVRVCSQDAKRVLDSTEYTGQLLSQADTPTAAILAPSFPAEFPELSGQELAAMLRYLGFDYVNEVGFGADLVARQYRLLLQSDTDNRYIATSCPALVAYVEKYFPQIVPALAPIVSPMIATARVIREKHGENINIVFIGPCIAKKEEAGNENVGGDVQTVLTFNELRAMLEEKNAFQESLTPSEFDPPRAGLGALFPITRGLLQAAEIEEDLLTDEIVATDGRTNFVQAIREFADGHMEARLLEVLCCNGCIMGAGMSNDSPMFSRRNRVSKYVRKRWSNVDRARWQEDIAAFSHIDLKRKYQTNDQRIAQPSPKELQKILKKLGKEKPEDELNCGACGYDTCREHAVAIYKGLAENEMCLPYTIEELQTTIDQLENSNKELANTQEALMHSERLASMGQLAAGVAHEVNNPLGIVLMYAHMLLEEVQGKDEWSEDLETIVEQADRCKKIVSRLLNFARQNKGIIHRHNVHDVVQKTLTTLTIPDGINCSISQTTDDPEAEIDSDQITQVITNIITNAIDAMGGDTGNLAIEISGDDNNIQVRVSDTGSGIAEENREKIFEPFFTTKQIGKGTGLGLAVTHGIVKMHRGQIYVESNSDPEKGQTGTTFTIELPRKSQEQ